MYTGTLRLCLRVWKRREGEDFGKKEVRNRGH